jgi:CheY-like chemotaxis protein
MADTAEHALVLHLDSQVALRQQQVGPLSSMVSDALTLALAREPAPESGISRPSILIADDDRPLLNYLSELLAPHFSVLVVTDGIDAADRMLASDFDIIVSNVALPGLAGEALYSLAKPAKPHLCDRFIFVTISAEPNSALTFVASTGCRLLVKPVRLDQWDEALLFVLKKINPARFRSVESVFVS